MNRKPLLCHCSHPVEEHEIMSPSGETRCTSRSFDGVRSDGEIETFEEKCDCTHYVGSILTQIFMDELRRRLAP